MLVLHRICLQILNMGFCNLKCRKMQHFADMKSLSMILLFILSNNSPRVTDPMSGVSSFSENRCKSPLVSRSWMELWNSSADGFLRQMSKGFKHKSKTLPTEPSILLASSIKCTLMMDINSLCLAFVEVSSSCQNSVICRTGSNMPQYWRKI